MWFVSGNVWHGFAALCCYISWHGLGLVQWKVIAQEIAILLARSYYGVLKNEMEEIAIHIVQSYYGILQM